MYDLGISILINKGTPHDSGRVAQILLLILAPLKVNVLKYLLLYITEFDFCTFLNLNQNKLDNEQRTKSTLSLVKLK